MARELGPGLRELVPTVLVAFLVCHLIRSNLLEWYLVPSSSMEPVLHGDPIAGDVVLVDKTAFWGGRRPARFEMVVLRNPEAEADAFLVKRAVAFGDDAECCVLLQDGDLFLGTSGQDLQRVVKDPLAHAGMAMTHFAFPEVGDQRVEDYFRADPAWRVDRSNAAAPTIELRAAAATPADLAAALLAAGDRRRGVDPSLPGWLGTRRPVDTTFLDSTARRRGSVELYRDVGIEVEVAPRPGCTGVALLLELGERSVALVYGADGRWELLDRGRPLGLAAAASSGRMAPESVRRDPGPALDDGPHRLRYGYLDGWLFAVVDGVLVLHRPLDVGPDPSLQVPVDHNLLHVAALGQVLDLRRVRTFHDVYYKAWRGPLGEASGCYRVPAGEMFLLGDNTFDSRDSRTGRTYAMADLVGAPLGVISPSGRRRWLSR